MEKLKSNKKVSGSHHNYNDSIMPVIKIDFKGEILYANMSSFDLLLNWACFASSNLPLDVVRKIQSNCINNLQTFDVKFNHRKINFMVVPFPEAGYIGIYGFEFTSEKINN